MSEKKQQLEKDLISWRRAAALELYSTGTSITKIAETLKVDKSTISRDIEHLRKEAKEKQGEYIQSLPFEHVKSVTSIDRVHKELWELFDRAADNREKKTILDSISDVIIKRQLLLGDPAAIQRALQQIARVKKALEKEQEV